MKKYIIILAAALVSALFTGCSTSAGYNDDDHMRTQYNVPGNNSVSPFAGQGDWQLSPPVEP